MNVNIFKRIVLTSAQRFLPRKAVRSCSLHVLWGCKHSVPPSSESFFSQRMVRIAGYANGIGDEGLTPIAEDERRKDMDMIMMDNRGNKWLRFETRGGRAYAPIIESEAFELWEGLDHPGWILVERTPALVSLKNLLYSSKQLRYR